MLSSLYINVFYQLMYQINRIHKIKTNFSSLEPTPNPYCPLLKFEIAPTLNTFVELKNQNDRPFLKIKMKALPKSLLREREGEGYNISSAPEVQSDRSPSSVTIIREKTHKGR